eukprot:Nk52_evm10s327 gene=Nk52_evmTU10s327
MLETVACANPVAISRYLKRFTRNELLAALEERPGATNLPAEVHELKIKKDVVDYIVRDLWENKLVFDDLSHLELYFHYVRSRQKTWTVQKIVPLPKANRYLKMAAAIANSGNLNSGVVINLKTLEDESRNGLLQMNSHVGSEAASIDSEKLKEELEAFLNAYFYSHVTVKVFDQHSYWIQIYLYDSIKSATGKRGSLKYQDKESTKTSMLINNNVDTPGSSSAGVEDSSLDQTLLPTSCKGTTVIYYPKSRVLITSVVKTEYKEYINMAFLKVLEGQEIQELSLSGKDLKSLESMVLNQNSQGSWSKFRENLADDNPLSLAGTGKQKLKSDDEATDADLFDSDSENELIVDENEEREAKRKRLDRTVFGERKLPALQKIDFQMESNLKASNHSDIQETFSSSDDTIKCRVRFEGTAVLEGIKKLVNLGIIAHPLPSYLSDVHSNASNVFKISADEIDRDLLSRQSS